MAAATNDKERTVLACAAFLPTAAADIEGVYEDKLMNVTSSPDKQ